MKNRTSSIFAISIIILAIIGIMSRFIGNPTVFLQKLAVLVVLGLAIYFLFKRFYKLSPEKKDQKAFLRAAKKTARKVHRKKADETTKHRPLTKLTSIKKKSSAHLTVIEGKKNKKKNRASF